MPRGCPSSLVCRPRGSSSRPIAASRPDDPHQRENDCERDPDRAVMPERDEVAGQDEHAVRPTQPISPPFESQRPYAPARPPQQACVRLRPEPNRLLLDQKAAIRWTASQTTAAHSATPPDASAATIPTARLNTARSWTPTRTIVPITSAADTHVLVRTRRRVAGPRPPEGKRSGVISNTDAANPSPNSPSARPPAATLPASTETTPASVTNQMASTTYVTRSLPLRPESPFDAATFGDIPGHMLT